jgi:hypothetical protein
MHHAPEPLALDPLGPMGIGPIADANSPAVPLRLDPLSPVDAGTYLTVARARTGDLTRHSHRRELDRANAKVTT